MQAEAERGSVTNLIFALREGSSTAATGLCDRYYNRLVRLARRWLEGMPTLRADDEEDAALSAIRSMLLGVSNGKFPRVVDRSNLWRLLCSITYRRLLKQVEYEHRLKRGGGKVATEADFPQDPDAHDSPLDRVADRRIGPEHAVIFAEGSRILLDILPSEELKSIALYRLEGFTDEEIAKKHDVTRRTIVRKVALIRGHWRVHAAAIGIDTEELEAQSSDSDGDLA